MIPVLTPGFISKKIALKYFFTAVLIVKSTDGTTELTKNASIDSGFIPASRKYVSKKIPN